MPRRELLLFGAYTLIVIGLTTFAECVSLSWVGPHIACEPGTDFSRSEAQVLAHARWDTPPEWKIKNLDDIRVRVCSEKYVARPRLVLIGADADVRLAVICGSGALHFVEVK